MSKHLMMNLIDEYHHNQKNKPYIIYYNIKIESKLLIYYLHNNCIYYYKSKFVWERNKKVIQCKSHFYF